MDKQSKLILAVVAVVAGAAFLYSRNKEKKALTVAKAAPTTDANTASFAKAKEGDWVVGGYDATTNETYIFPAGNIGGGRRIRGRLNIPQGSIFTPAPAVVN